MPNLVAGLIIINGEEWTPFEGSEGSFNDVYLNSNQSLILKVPRPLEDPEDPQSQMDSPARAVRLWKDINPDLPQAKLIELEDRREAWIGPFIPGKTASDEEIQEALIDIYMRTGRIVVDALSPNNFIKTVAKPSRIVCVDMGMALQLEKQQGSLLDTRRASVASSKLWNAPFDPHGATYSAVYEHLRYKRHEENYPEIVNTIRVLLFLKDNRPDIRDLSFLKEPEVFQKLVSAYKGQNKDEALQLLESKQPATLEFIKASCIRELTQYIESRGVLHEGKFSPSWWTQFSKEELVTAGKIDQTLKLISKIETAESIGAVKQAIADTQSNRSIKKGTSGDFRSSLNQCASIIEVVKISEEIDKITDEMDKISDEIDKTSEEIAEEMDRHNNLSI